MTTGPSWDEARELMSRGARSDAWREAGCWALGVLEDELGRDWPALAWEMNGCNWLPPEVMLSAAHIVAYRDLLDLALRLRIVHDLPGAAKLRTAVRTNPTHGRLYHTRLQLELAAFSCAAGHTVELESRALPGSSPSDVVIHVAGDVPLPFETFVCLRSEDAQTVDGYTDVVNAAITDIHIRHHVGITGRFDLLEEEARLAMLDELGVAAKMVSSTGSEQVIAGEGFDFQVVADHVFNVEGAAFVGDPLGRLSRRLLNKAHQAESSGARWLRVDVLDGLWQFTPWAFTTLTEKAATLSAATQSVLGDASELDGLVITSGLLLAATEFEHEEVWSGGTCALRRASQPSRVRESIVIPLRPDAKTDLLVGMYRNEPNWLGNALASAGLAAPSTLFGTD